MENEKFNDDYYKKVNKKIFIIQIIFLIALINFIIAGIILILSYKNGRYWTPIPGIMLIAMPTIFIGSIELMLYIARHQRDIFKYQMQATIPVAKEAIDNTSNIQKTIAKNVIEEINQYCYCQECGSKNFIDAKFCSTCGKEINRL